PRGGRGRGGNIGNRATATGFSRERAQQIADLVAAFKSSGRIVIVGASLAGLRAAEALRNEGFSGHLTIIGDEPYEPYDRPPLSKQELQGWVPADHTALPRVRAIDAEWRLGVAGTGLGRGNPPGHLAKGGPGPLLHPSNRTGPHTPARPAS